MVFDAASLVQSGSMIGGCRWDRRKRESIKNEMEMKDMREGKLTYGTERKGSDRIEMIASGLCARC